jgi:hypothetical protein
LATFPCRPGHVASNPRDRRIELFLPPFFLPPSRDVNLRPFNSKVLCCGKSYAVAAARDHRTVARAFAQNIPPEFCVIDL